MLSSQVIIRTFPLSFQRNISWQTSMVLPAVLDVGRVALQNRLQLSQVFESSTPTVSRKKCSKVTFIVMPSIQFSVRMCTYTEPSRRHDSQKFSLAMQKNVVR